MSTSLIKRTQNTLTATAYLPYGAYKALAQLAKDHNTEIAKTAEGFATVTFSSAKTAESVAKKFRADYAEAHAAYVSAHTSEPAPAPKQEAKPHKPTTNGKGNAKVLKKLDKLAGKGKSANKQAAAVIREFGIEPNGAEWDYWKSIR
jgi:hypothetical protein